MDSPCWAKTELDGSIKSKSRMKKIGDFFIIIIKLMWIFSIQRGVFVVVGQATYP